MVDSGLNRLRLQTGLTVGEANESWSETWLDTLQPHLVGGVPTLLNNDGVSNSWDDDIPNIWKNNPNVPNHQPVYYGNLVDTLQESNVAGKSPSIPKKNR